MTDYTPLRDKRVVAIDPNISDLLYCVDGDTKDPLHAEHAASNSSSTASNKEPVKGL